MTFEEYNNLLSNEVYKEYIIDLKNSGYEFEYNFLHKYGEIFTPSLDVPFRFDESRFEGFISGWFSKELDGIRKELDNEKT